MTLPTCKNKVSEKKITIGIISSNEYEKTPIWNGLTGGLSELGYYEGKNLTYFKKKVPEQDKQKIDDGINELLGHKLTFLMTFGGDIVDAQVQEFSKGKNISVLFSSAPSPVETGLVKSIGYPSGNITGVQSLDVIPKALEFIKKIIPAAKKIYIPYNPEDLASTAYLAELNLTASQIGVELILHKIHSVEEAATSIENLADDVDAIFMIPSPTLNPRNDELSKAALKRRIPMGSALYLDNDILITYTGDFYEVGKKMAKITKEISEGIKPADIPVETMDTILIINLKTAEKIGVQIPNGILAQASVIIR
jgi:putative tryptophan/tyrosine transport system substrate-binding protein